MEKKTFAYGYCFKKIFIFFLIGCLLGTYYEEVLWFIRHGEYSSRQGLLYGDFSPIYGVGVMIFVIFLGKKNDSRSILKTFIFAAIIGGVTEFMTSLIAEQVFGVQFWDYSHKFLNVMGRTTIPFMVGWGIGGTVLMKLVYPFISRLIEKIPYNIGNVIFNIIFIVIMADIVLTYSALGRMALRNNKVKPYTIIGEVYDKYYNNEYLYDKFPIMRPKK